MTISAKRLILVAISVSFVVLVAYLLVGYVLGTFNFDGGARTVIAVVFVVVTFISSAIMNTSSKDTIERWHDTISCAKDKLNDEECKNGDN